KEQSVRALGAVPIYGHLADPELYQHFAAESDVVIHAAFESPDRERFVAEELISALKAEGEKKSFILTSGVLVLGETGATPVDEKASTERPFPLVEWRPGVERYALDQATDDLSVAVVRPGFVYGGDTGGTLGGYVHSALERGATEFVGAG